MKWNRGGVYVKSNRVVGALNHEVGHAYDTSGLNSKLWSTKSAFRAAYRKDYNKLRSASVVDKQKVSYYMQGDGGPAGRSETFAECFANVMGREINGGMDMDRYFPNCLSYVKELLD